MVREVYERRRGLSVRCNTNPSQPPPRNPPPVLIVNTPVPHPPPPHNHHGHPNVAAPAGSSTPHRHLGQRPLWSTVPGQESGWSTRGSSIHSTKQLSKRTLHGVRIYRSQRNTWFSLLELIKSATNIFPICSGACCTRCQLGYSFPDSFFLHPFGWSTTPIINCGDWPLRFPSRIGFHAKLN